MVIYQFMVAGNDHNPYSYIYDIEDIEKVVWNFLKIILQNARPWVTTQQYMIMRQFFTETFNRQQKNYISPEDHFTKYI